MSNFGDFRAFVDSPTPLFMMLCNKPVRRMARGLGQHMIPRGRAPRLLLEEGDAEGATAPETLRQKDRDRVMNFWKVKRPLFEKKRLFPPKG